MKTIPQMSEMIRKNKEKIANALEEYEYTEEQIKEAKDNVDMLESLDRLIRTYVDASQKCRESVSRLTKNKKAQAFSVTLLESIRDLTAIAESSASECVRRSQELSRLTREKDRIAQTDINEFWKEKRVLHGLTLQEIPEYFD